MKFVNIQYFAILREQAKTENESLKIECRTYKDLYQHLQAKHSFTIPLEMVRVAVNSEFAQLNDEILENAEIVFIPPVAGG